MLKGVERFECGEKYMKIYAFVSMCPPKDMNSGKIEQYFKPFSIIKY